MSGIADTVARILASREGRAIPVRRTSSLLEDPTSVFAIAPIKMVSEEIIQAVVFGDPNREPRLITRWNPLSREAGDLEPLAVALDDYVTSALEEQALPRIWLPHKSALTLIELLGHRYRTNQVATERLQRMGALCWAIAEEERFPGQQVVAVACDLLKAHVVTGQAPIKDGHLGALMAWTDPLPDVDPAEEADRRALVPASGVLARRDDDEVERLRRIAKRGGSRGDRARAGIIEILERGARAEWDLLLGARRSFWGLGLPSAARDQLARASIRRTAFSFKNSFGPRVAPHALARELAMHEYAADLVEDADHRNDSNVRERARSKGRAIRAQVVEVQQPKKSCRPCVLMLRTEQEALRVRIGTQLQTLDARVSGRVLGVTEDATGAALLRLTVTNGVRSRPSSGWTGDWVDTVVFDEFMMEKSMREVYGAMKENQAPLVYGSGVAGTATIRGRAEDLLTVAEGLKR